MNSAADWYADQEQRERIMKTDTKAKLRLIDADALMKKVCGNCQRNDCTPDATDTVYGCMFAESINQMPTIEPEVRHGRWIFVGEETSQDGWTHRKYKCSECEFQTVEAVNFCQKCGADMRDGGSNGG